MSRVRRSWRLLAVGLIVAGVLTPLILLRIAPPPQRHPPVRAADPETSCGPVSLAVVGEFLGKPLSIAEFHAATGSGELGTCSMTDLLRALRGNGFSAEAVRYDPGRPPGHRLPMVLFVDGNHFLAALPGRKGQVVLVDPPQEPKLVAWGQLAARWRGEAVVVGLREEDIRLALAQR